MKNQICIIYLFLCLIALNFASDINISSSNNLSSQIDQDLIESYNLAKSYRANKEFDKCLSILFEIKDNYLKANFDIASIFYQDYKSYDIALHFFNTMIQKYESSNDQAFLISNEDIYKNAIFFSAYILVNDLELYTSGVSMYQKFIENFPNDELADDATHEVKTLNSELNQIELLKNTLK